MARCQQLKLLQLLLIQPDGDFIRGEGDFRSGQTIRHSAQHIRHAGQLQSDSEALICRENGLVLAAILPNYCLLYTSRCV